LQSEILVTEFLVIEIIFNIMYF